MWIHWGETSTNASPSYPTHHPVAVRHIRWHPSSTCRKNHQNISSLKPSPQCVALRDGPSWGVGRLLCEFACESSIAELAYQKVSGQLSFSKTESNDHQCNKRTKKTNFWLHSKLLDTESTILPIWPVWGAFCFCTRLYFWSMARPAFQLVERWIYKLFTPKPPTFHETLISLGLKHEVSKKKKKKKHISTG